MNTFVDAIQKCSLSAPRKTSDGGERDYVFRPDFLGFQGHFPRHPVLPAIVQLIMVRDSIAEQVNQDLELVKIRHAKFLKVVSPGIPVTAKWTIKESGEDYVCKCVLESEGERTSSFELSLRPTSSNNA